MSMNYLKTFVDDETIKANDTNSNNQFLLSRIDESAQNLMQYLENEIERLQGSFILPGFIIGLPYDTIPTGYLKCDGSSLLIADYEDLYNAIGTIYGQEDSTQFNLPDFQGMFLRGAGGSAATIGTLQAGAAPNVKGSVTVWGLSTGALTQTKTGCLYMEQTGSYYGARSASDIGNGRLLIDASQNSEVYKDDIDELYPNNYAVHWIIKY